MSALELSYLVLLPLVPLLPLLVFVALWPKSSSALALRLAPWSALPGVLLALLPPAAIQVNLSWMLLGGSFGLDATGRVFVFLFALLWTSAGWYAQGYLKEDARRRRFWAFFLLAMSGNLGLPLALGLLDFYFFFALMSFSAYGLVVHDDSPFAQRAGRIYLYLVLFGEVLLFVALVLVVRAGGSLLLSDAGAAIAQAPERALILTLLVGGLGIKAGLVPLHVWLPLAHPAAPVPASAVLSGAMIKVGLLGLIRVLPLGTIALPGWSQALILMGLLMAFFGVAVGVVQTQPKVVLAYSSISQMGFPLIGLGLALARPELWPLLATAVALYALHHGLAKGALFLGVGMAGELAASGRRRWLTLGGLLLPALALAGAPLTSGALAKSALKPFVDVAPGFLAILLPLSLSLAAVGTTLLMARFFYVLWPDSRATHAPEARMWGGWALLAGGLVLCSLGVLPVGAVPAAQHGSPAQLWAMVWPVATGLVLALGVWQRTRSTRVAEPIIPPGDLLLALEGGLSPLLRLVAHLRPDSRQRGWRLRPPPGYWWHNLALLLSLREAEQAMRRLSVAGVLFLLILLLLMIL
jgi:formate hydrogenlyase subunit 3/multisubunit Na+/H+ antiporter MnhD subunit